MVKKLVAGDLDLFTVKKDERLHQVLDVLAGNVLTIKLDDDKPQLIVSDDEDVEGKPYKIILSRCYSLKLFLEPPLPTQPASVTESQKAADELKMKGNEQYGKKNLKQALEFYQQAADMDPTSPVILSNMAAVYTDMKKIDLARELCQRSIEKSRQYGIKRSTLAKVYNRLGTLDHTEGHYRQAIAWFRRSIKLDGEYGKAKSNLQRCESRLASERRKAMWDLEKANKLMKEANKLIEQDKSKEAYELFKDVTKYIPSAEVKLQAKVHVGCGKCHLCDKKYHSALMEADKAIELDKDCHTAYTIKGIAHEGLNAYESATAAYTVSNYLI